MLLSLNPPAEIHIVAAPTEAFFLRVQLLAASIRRYAGAFASSRIVVTLSRDHEPWDVDAAFAWSRQLQVEWRWVDQAIWDAHGIYGSALARFTYDYQSPYVIHLDADTLCTGALDELPARTREALGGVIAHVAPSAFAIPFRDGRVHHGAAFWEELVAGAGLAPVPMTSEHTGWGLMDADPARRWCPPYYNLGMLAGTREVMSRVGGAVLEQLASVEAQVDTHFRCQLAVTLALAAVDAPSVDLSPAWNFPNDQLFRLGHGQAARDVRVLHYLRGGEFERERDTASLAALDGFLVRRLEQPTNQLLQSVLRRLRDGLGPTELPQPGARRSLLTLRADDAHVA